MQFAPKIILIQNGKTDDLFELCSTILVEFIDTEASSLVHWIWFGCIVGTWEGYILHKIVPNSMMKIHRLLLIIVFDNINKKILGVLIRSIPN